MCIITIFHVTHLMHSMFIMCTMHLREEKWLQWHTIVLIGIISFKLFFDDATMFMAFQYPVLLHFQC